MGTKKKTKVLKKEPVLLAEKKTNELLSLMGTKARAKVTEDKGNEAIKISIETEDETGLLIGRHGETIEAIQAALGMMLKNATGDWVRLIVDIGDWREKQEEKLKNLAGQAAERAKATGEDQLLYNLTPSQRRIIHLAFAKNPDIETESSGEGEERYLVIRPKK